MLVVRLLQETQNNVRDLTSFHVGNHARKRCTCFYKGRRGLMLCAGGRGRVVTVTSACCVCVCVLGLEAKVEESLRYLEQECGCLQNYVRKEPAHRRQEAKR